MKTTKRINDGSDHHHYWIENEILYQSYLTIRGLRYRVIQQVPGMPDTENYIPDER